MKTKDSVLTLRIPVELKHKLEIIAGRQGVSLNQLAMYALTKEITELELSDHFARYWKNHTKKEIMDDFDTVMSKIDNRKVPEWDRM